MRSGGLGIPAFYTPTGVGTFVEYGHVPVKYIQGSAVPIETSKPKEVLFNIIEFCYKIY